MTTLASGLRAATPPVRSVFPMAERWSVDIPGAPVAQAPPISDDRHVYMALGAGQILAMSLADGIERWRRKLSTDRPLAAEGGLVFVAAGDAVHALRGVDGKTAWEAPIGPAAAPLLARGGWLIAIADGRLIAFRAADGSRVWQKDIGASRQRPAIDGDRLYVSLEDGRVLALELASGKSIWEQRVGGVPGGIFATADRLYVGASDRHFYCLLTKDGLVDWHQRVGALVQGHPAGDDEHVYFVATDNVLRALDRSNGALRWQHPLARRPATGPIVIGRTVLLPSTASDLWAVDTKSGQSSGAVPTPSQLAVPPDLVDEGELGVFAFVITGGLSNDWKLTLVGPAGDPPLAALTRLPGVAAISDPVAVPLSALPGLTRQPAH